MTSTAVLITIGLFVMCVHMIAAVYLVGSRYAEGATYTVVGLLAADFLAFYRPDAGTLTVIAFTITTLVFAHMARIAHHSTQRTVNA